MSIIFEVSDDPQLLEQYYQLREQCFQQELGIPDFDGSEQEQDRRGQILIARDGDVVIGGARISREIPLEDQLSELKVDSDHCCIWERFVFAPAARSLKVIRDFTANLIYISRMEGYHHAVVLSSLRNARLYRQLHSALGVGFEIHQPVPECAQGSFADLEHYLSVSDLQEPEPMLMAA